MPSMVSSRRTMRSASSTREADRHGARQRLDHLAQDIEVDDADHAVSPDAIQRVRSASREAGPLRDVEASPPKRDRAVRASPCPAGSSAPKFSRALIARDDMKMHMRIDHHQHQIVDPLICHKVAQTRFDVAGGAAPVPHRPRAASAEKARASLLAPRISEPSVGCAGRSRTRQCL